MQSYIVEQGLALKWGGTLDLHGNKATIHAVHGPSLGQQYFLNLISVYGV